MIENRPKQSLDRFEVKLQKEIKAGSDARNLRQTEGWLNLAEWMKARIEVLRGKLESDTESRNMEEVKYVRGQITALRMVLAKPEGFIKAAEVARRKMDG